MAEPDSASHGPSREREGHSDGKGGANEMVADESGREYRDEEVNIERIEEVYRYENYDETANSIF